MKAKLKWGDLDKKNGKEAVGRGINWGFSSPHTLLPKEEKEEKNALCMSDFAKKVPLNGNNNSFGQETLGKG
jgi:hypothetical protein